MNNLQLFRMYIKFRNEREDIERLWRGCKASPEAWEEWQEWNYLVSRTQTKLEKRLVPQSLIEINAE